MSSLPRYGQRCELRSTPDNFPARWYFQGQPGWVASLCPSTWCTTHCSSLRQNNYYWQLKTFYIIISTLMASTITFLIADIDECSVSDSCNATTEDCSNTIGGFNCSCKTGFSPNNNSICEGKQRYDCGLFTSNWTAKDAR